MLTPTTLVRFDSGNETVLSCDPIVCAAGRSFRTASGNALILPLFVPGGTRFERQA
jgi:hypothetical protein